MSGGAVPPGTPVVPEPFRPLLRPLRPAPEQREMALIAGLAFFLNLFPGTGLQFLDARWGLVVSQTIFIAGPVLLALRWFYLDRRTILPIGRPTTAGLTGALLGTLALNHLLTLASIWQERVFPSPQPLRDFFAALFVYEGPADFARILAAFALVPAVCEEILFRGFLQAGLMQLLESPGRAIGCSALLFALFHLDPWRFAAILILGVFLGYLAHRTGSLVPSILAHALNNVVSISLMASGVIDHDRSPGSPWSVALAIGLFAGAVLLLRGGGARRAAGGVL